MIVMVIIIFMVTGLEMIMIENAELFIVLAQTHIKLFNIHFPVKPYIIYKTYCVDNIAIIFIFTKFH